MRRCASLCERAKNAAALPCYADSERDLERLIDGEMRAAGLTLKPDARAMLIPLLGGDRAASRNELRKLALYARGRGEIDVDDIDRGGLRRFGAGARRTRRCRVRRPAGRPRGADRQGAHRRELRSARSCSPRSASSRSCTNGASRSRAGAPFSVDSVQPPVHFRRKSDGRGGAQAMERGAACRRHGRTCRRGAGLAAHAGARRHHRRARAARDRGEGAAQRSVAIPA